MKTLSEDETKQFFLFKQQFVGHHIEGFELRFMSNHDNIQSATDAWLDIRKKPPERFANYTLVEAPAGIDRETFFTMVDCFGDPKDPQIKPLSFITDDGEVMYYDQEFASGFKALLDASPNSFLYSIVRFDHQPLTEILKIELESAHNGLPAAKEALSVILDRKEHSKDLSHYALYRSIPALPERSLVRSFNSRGEIQRDLAEKILTADKYGKVKANSQENIELFQDIVTPENGYRRKLN